MHCFLQSNSFMNFIPAHCFTISVFSSAYGKDKSSCQKYGGFFVCSKKGTRIKQICFLASSFILDRSVAWYRKRLMRNLTSVKMTFFSIESGFLTWPEDSSIGKLFYRRTSSLMLCSWRHRALYQKCIYLE